MIITKLENISNRKVKVYIDEEYTFSLYPNEIDKYIIRENEEISEEKLKNIMENVVYKKAKAKALMIVRYMDRSEFEIRRKLEKEDFQEGIIDKTIEYLYHYHYIDDYRLCQNYIQSKITKKSKRQIIFELQKKGIRETLIEEVFAKEFVDEDAAIRKLIAKKFKSADDFNKEKKQKIYAALVRKGFNPSDVMRIIKDIEQNNSI